MATGYADVDDRSVSIGRIFSRAFGVMGANPLATFGISFLFASLPQQILSLLSAGLRLNMAQSGTKVATVAVSLVTFAIMIALLMLTQGALVRATVAFSEGGEASLSESAMAGLHKILPLFAVALLSGIGIMLGFILLVVPGVILAIMWCVAAPVLVDENLGVMASLRRSSSLTKGARWKLFGIGLVIIVLYWIVSAAFLAALVAVYGMQGMVGLAQGLNPVIIILNLVVGTVLTTFWATMQTSTYVELRNWKDGPASARLAEIFE